MLLTKELEITVTGNMAKYYEDLGYIIPKYYNKNKRGFCVKRGTKIIIKLEHLHKGSAIKIACLCDYCLEQGVKTVIYKNYQNYLKSVNGVIHKDSCKKMYW